MYTTYKGTQFTITHSRKKASKMTKLQLPVLKVGVSYNKQMENNNLQFIMFSFTCFNPFFNCKSHRSNRTRS